MFDTHLHLDAEPFSGDLPAVASAMARAGVRWAVNAAVDLNSSRASLQIHSSFPFVLPSVGLHPLYIEGGYPEELDALARGGGFYAVGEAGLDFWHGRENEEAQREVFYRQALLAKELSLPLLLHIRKGFNEVLEVLREAGFGGGALFHNFTGSLEMARKALDEGWSFSIGGPITYPRKEELRKVVRKIPLDRIMVETDAPDLPPWEKRGEIHRPEDLPVTVRALAGVLGLGFEEAAEITQANARKFFGV